MKSTNISPLKNTVVFTVPAVVIQVFDQLSQTWCRKKINKNFQIKLSKNTGSKINSLLERELSKNYNAVIRMQHYSG